MVSVHEIVDILYDDTVFVGDNARFVYFLGTPAAEKKQLQSLYLMGITSGYEHLVKLIEGWIKRTPSATLGKLKGILKKCNFLNIMESLGCLGDDSLSITTTFRETVRESQPLSKYWSVNDTITLPKSTITFQYQGVVPGYVERSDLQTDAIEHLMSKPNKYTDITFPITVLYGFGGNGKSQMARRLVQIFNKQKCCEGNNAWINASNESSILEGFRKLVCIDKEVLQKDISDFMTAIYRQLCNRKLLLVFDDGDDMNTVRKFLPCGIKDSGVKVIVTAHNEWLCADQNIKNIPIGNFAPVEFTQFLDSALTYPISSQELKQLEGHTGRIPAIISLIYKGFKHRRKRDSSYTIAAHLKKYGDELFKFDEDGKLIPGVSESIYKKSAKIVVKQQLRCMDNWEHDTIALMDLAKVILNYLAYCSPVISEEYFLKKHPQILKQANWDHNDIVQAIGVLVEFGWVDILFDENGKDSMDSLEKNNQNGEEDNDESVVNNQSKLETVFNSSSDFEIAGTFETETSNKPCQHKVISIHLSYQIALKSLLSQNAEEYILQGMIDYMQTEGDSAEVVHEKGKHLPLFWYIVADSKSLSMYASKTRHCLAELIRSNMVSEAKSFSINYTDKNMVQALLEPLKTTPTIGCNFSPMSFLFSYKQAECIRFFISKIKPYYERNCQSQTWIVDHLYQVAVCAITLKKLDYLKLVLDTFRLNINEGVGRFKYTLLHFSVYYHNADIVQFLINEGCSVDVQNVFGDTPTHLAVQIHNLEILSILLRKGAKSQETKSSWKTAMNIAVVQDSLEMVKLFLQNGADINAEDDKGRSALHSAVLLDSPKMLNFLIENGIDINKKDNAGVSAFHIAIVESRLDMIKLLQLAGAEINTKDGNSALHLAVSLKNIEIVNVMLETGVEVNGTNNLGENACQLAVRNGSLKIVKILLQHGIRIKEKNSNGRDLLFSAVWAGNVAMVNILLGQEAELYDIDFYNIWDLVRTVLDEEICPLYWLYSNNKLEAVQYFLAEIKAFGRQLQNLEKRPWILFQLFRVADIANKAGALDFLDFILDDCGLLMESPNEQHDTPLHYAVRAQNPDIVQLAVEKGCSVHDRNRDGNLPLHLAALGENLEILTFLLTKGANAFEENDAGNTPLFLAVGQGNLAAVKILLANSSNINVRNRQKDNALHLAVRNGSVDMVKIFLGNGSCTGYRALSIAICAGNWEVVKILVKEWKHFFYGGVPFICMVFVLVVCKIYFACCAE